MKEEARKKTRRISPLKGLAFAVVGGVVCACACLMCVVAIPTSPEIKTQVAMTQTQRAIAQSYTTTPQSENQSTPKPEPTSTFAAVQTAEPSPTPRLASGIGVSRAEVQSDFEALGFVFEQVENVNGAPHFVGSSPNGLMAVHLIGPKDELTKAEIAVLAEGLSSDELEIVTGYLSELLDVIVPEWEGRTTWVKSNMDLYALFRAGSEKVDLNGLQVYFSGNSSVVGVGVRLAP